jgi:hypothetical protein
MVRLFWQKSQELNNWRWLAYKTVPHRRLGKSTIILSHRIPSDLHGSPYFSMTYAPFIAFFDRSPGIFALSLPS